jgi:hypothetical protein
VMRSGAIPRPSVTQGHETTDPICDYDTERPRFSNPFTHDLLAGPGVRAARRMPCGPTPFWDNMDACRWSR